MIDSNQLAMIWCYNCEKPSVRILHDGRRALCACGTCGEGLLILASVNMELRRQCREVAAGVIGPYFREGMRRALLFEAIEDLKKRCEDIMMAAVKEVAK